MHPLQSEDNWNLTLVFVVQHLPWDIFKKTPSYLNRYKTTWYTCGPEGHSISTPAVNNQAWRETLNDLVLYWSENTLCTCQAHLSLSHRSCPLSPLICLFLLSTLFTPPHPVLPSLYNAVCITFCQVHLFPSFKEIICMMDCRLMGRMPSTSLRSYCTVTEVNRTTRHKKNRTWRKEKRTHAHTPPPRGAINSTLISQQ